MLQLVEFDGYTHEDSIMLALTFYQFWPTLSVSINDLSFEMLS